MYYSWQLISLLHKVSNQRPGHILLRSGENSWKWPQSFSCSQSVFLWLIIRKNNHCRSVISLPNFDLDIKVNRTWKFMTWCIGSWPRKLSKIKSIRYDHDNLILKHFVLQVNTLRCTCNVLYCAKLWMWRKKIAENARECYTQTGF